VFIVNKGDIFWDYLYKVVTNGKGTYTNLVPIAAVTTDEQKGRLGLDKWKKVKIASSHRLAQINEMPLTKDDTMFIVNDKGIRKKYGYYLDTAYLEPRYEVSDDTFRSFKDFVENL
jgi:hypothetical protein